MARPEWVLHWVRSVETVDMLLRLCCCFGGKVAQELVQRKSREDQMVDLHLHLAR